jgi:hypothetical protein
MMFHELHVIFAIVLSMAEAFAPPFGMGAILFKPNVKIVKSNGEDERLVDAGKFFVDAFW